MHTLLSSTALPRTGLVALALALASCSAKRSTEFRRDCAEHAADSPRRTPRPGAKMLDVAVPTRRARVNDGAHLLSADEAHRLEARLTEHETSTGQQLVLLTLERLPVADIDNFGYTVFNRWRLGRKCYDDGLLMTIALAERKVRIDVGYGLERAIPDARAAAVIANMYPLLRLERHGAAVEAAFDALIADAAATPATCEPACTDR